MRMVCPRYTCPIMGGALGRRRGGIPTLPLTAVAAAAVSGAIDLAAAPPC